MNEKHAFRQVVVNIETTGVDLAKAHRVVEIAAVELVDRRLTGKCFHTYVNPGREVDPGARAVHGLTNEFLQDKPAFGEIAREFLEFVRGAELVAHNALFDIGFLDGELAILKLDPLWKCCPSVIDTLQLARSLRPGQKNSLGALCSALGVGTPAGDLHGALLDARLLAEVFLKITQQRLH